jgi:16S rRNA (uracil1498-N3)-methyltransferase
MSIQRFFVDKDFIDEAQGQIVLASAKQVNQICHVLRLRVGSHICVLDGQGAVYACELEQLSKAKVKAKILEKSYVGEENGIKVTLALPLIKGGRFEWALEKLTELGVQAIQPVNFQRSVVKIAGSQQVSAKMEHWQAIVQESAEQCERAIIPRLFPPISLTDLLSELADYDLTICPVERLEAPLISQVLRDSFLSSGDKAVLPKHILVAVGPEGGFAEEEILQLSKALKVVSLGSGILRSETAALYCLTQIIAFSQIVI